MLTTVATEELIKLEGWAGRYQRGAACGAAIVKSHDDRAACFSPCGSAQLHLSQLAYGDLSGLKMMNGRVDRASWNRLAIGIPAVPGTLSGAMHFAALTDRRRSRDRFWELPTVVVQTR
ncbi:hypothetical protein Q8F57_043265 [Paraburkholderia terrae]|uniref:hypothetical protein n=1 Tax=Paraburkholderia terrae TaxID=311230 RepID=UPI00296B2945|nr:hypothetical protein [Paraburkholderia terrae]MDW3656571.1 hypothetical protein [Paraburkholderia terrae]